MKTILLTISVVLLIGFTLNAQVDDKTKTSKNLVGTKEKPIEIQKAKNHVYVELSKEKLPNGEYKVVSKEVKRIEIPETFPKYIDTGDPKTDEANYHLAKQKWIKEYPAEYQKIKHLNL